MKKKTLVPLIIFLLGICFVSLLVYKTDTHEKEQRHITAQLNVATYGEQIKNDITKKTIEKLVLNFISEMNEWEKYCNELDQNYCSQSRSWKY